MVGFPYHAADTYFRKIAELFELVVVENNVATVYGYDDDEDTEATKVANNENEPSLPPNLDDNDDFEEERALQKFFDKDALCTLYELFDYNIDMQ